MNLIEDKESFLNLLIDSKIKKKKKHTIKIFYILLALIPISFFMGILIAFSLLPTYYNIQITKSSEIKPLIVNYNYNFTLQHSKFTDQQKKIIEELKHSWIGYKKYAWGSDNLKPISREPKNNFHIGLTILDSLDTLILVNLKEELNDSIVWIKNNFIFNSQVYVNCFESTIRVLGSLLSAYHLTNEDIFKNKAYDFGDRLYNCYSKPDQKVPFSDINLKTKKGKASNYLFSSTSEVSTIQIEFRDLSRIVNDDRFEKISFQTSLLLHNLTKLAHNPLVQMYINPFNEQFKEGKITFGARADSYYEYLLKQYIQTGIKWLEEDYIDAIEAMKKNLLKKTRGVLKLVYIAELTENNYINPKQDHLVCFLSGTLALGYYNFNKKKRSFKKRLYKGKLLDEIYKEHLKIAEDLARTCYFTYNTTETGLAPEITYFDESETNEIYIKKPDRHNLLRPEYVESLFYLYHITGKEMYREQGRLIFNAFVTYSKVKTGGYTTINDVTNKDNVQPRDFQETYWISETLKYLFLLFSDEKKLIKTILEKFVFNSEGHLINLYY